MSQNFTPGLRQERGVSRALRSLRDADAALRNPSPDSVAYAATRIQAAIAAFAPVVQHVQAGENAQAGHGAQAAPDRLRPRALALARRIQRLKTRLQPALEFWYHQHLLRFGGAAYGPSAAPAAENARSWNG